MPQIDRHKNRTVYIEFVPAEDFNNLPNPERFTLVFVTSGSIKGLLNERPITISAPGVLCLTKEDTIQVIQKDNVSAQSFSFHPDSLSSIPISKTREFIKPNMKIQTVLSLFQRDAAHNGIYHITERAYPQLLEWFFVLGTEVYAQSDTLWVCRIKKYLIQITGLLEDLNRLSGQSPVDIVLAYIHTNYSDKISLKDLTNCAHLNRVSLNKMFQERCGCTAMGYLLSHRLKIASDLLTHTDMSLNEIARSTGFEYDTYFIKQFKSKRGISPTAYRKTSREFAAAI
ncbi:helix-turn-helix domain-containing protein [Anaerocolumna sp. MB42-C2]|uniref:helix-turn-helix domain-containing protein n=1 Tax=Anaerocolumna sp. MB42-C2 TaxID=3070997 RepID=UPI0027E10A91|nr:AraC family transcriptional regulator [Anaerocolumna sp. MB42-C2]WMJ90338.1 AraC family transcriptional regulator [Anaerocolumna sp. MB42-C2]